MLIRPWCLRVLCARLPSVVSCLPSVLLVLPASAHSASGIFQACKDARSKENVDWVVQNNFRLYRHGPALVPVLAVLAVKLGGCQSTPATSTYYNFVIIILFTPAQLRASVGASPFVFWREDLNLLMYPVRARLCVTTACVCLR